MVNTTSSEDQYELYTPDALGYYHLASQTRYGPKDVDGNDTTICLDVAALPSVPKNNLTTNFAIREDIIGHR